MAGTATKPATDSEAKTIQSTGAKSKIALSAIVPVEAPPEPKQSGRRSVMRDVADQLALKENWDKWFRVGEGKRTSAYQMRKRLKDLLPGIEVEVRTTDSENADVYARYSTEAALTAANAKA